MRDRVGRALPLADVHDVREQLRDVPQLAYTTGHLQFFIRRPRVRNLRVLNVLKRCPFNVLGAFMQSSKSPPQVLYRRAGEI